MPSQPLSVVWVEEVKLLRRDREADSVARLHVRIPWSRRDEVLSSDRHVKLQVRSGLFGQNEVAFNTAVGIQHQIGRPHEAIF